MKTTFLILLVCFLNSACATNYYFSAVSGDDSRTSTQAQNSSTPWKTLNKLNSFFSSLKPGDFILLKRGETFYGSIIIKKSGTSTSPITIGAYGTGSRPIITSLVKLTNWVSKSNGIWESYNSSLGSNVNIVLLNGVEQGMGRYPNNNATYNGYRTFESHVGKTSITDNQLTSTINWTGAELVMRTRRWILDRNLITSHSSTKIYYTTSDIYEPFDNYGYFIQNSIKTLDKFGEWYYNPSTKKLNVYFGSNDPSSYTIQATTKSNLISSVNYSSVVFDNLTFKGANGTGGFIQGGSNMNIKNCDILFSGQTGIVVNNHTNLKIENCTIANSNNNGIKFEYGVNYATVRNNKILNTSVIPGMGISGDGQGIAIYNHGDGNIFEYNEIRNTGYIGISFKGNNITIKNNLIDSFCLTKDDGSGIYSNADFVSYQGTKVTGNIVMNGIGAIPGTGPSIYSTSGIYLDNSSSKVQITDNTLVNCHDYGMYIHNAGSMTINNNTFFDNNRRQLTMVQSVNHPGTVRNNLLTHNIFFSKLQTQLVSYIESTQDDISYFGTFDSNYYARPLDDRITIANSYPGVNTNLDLDGWKKEYGDDPASKKTAKQIAAYKLKSLIGSNKVANGTFTSSITGVSASSCTISLSISGLLDGGYLQVVPSSKKSSVSIKIGGLTSGKKYIVKYSVKGYVNNNMAISTFLKESVSPYSILTPAQNRKVSTTRTENEMIFLATSSKSAVSVVFQVDQQSKYYLDNIRVYEADAAITNPDDSIRFVYNATKVNKTVTLSGSYIDTKGNTFSNSITLLPYKSAILIKTNSTVSTFPTVSITSPLSGAKYSAPATIKLTANASDADGTISKVAFYSGTTLLHTENLTPYEYLWENVPAGNYTITAKATDNSGHTTTSAGVLVYVVSNKAPTVSITSPSNNANYTAGSTITIKASASDADGSVKKVEFYKGTTLLKTEYTAPYSYTWGNVPAGNYTLTAKATDNSGLKTTSASVSISVVTSTLARGIASSADTTSTIAAADTITNMRDSIDAVNKQNLSSSLIRLKLGPNPAINDLNIFTSGLPQNEKLIISIYSISGVLIRTIQTGTPNQVVQLDISSLISGSYIVRVKCGENVLSKRFVKLY